MAGTSLDKFRTITQSEKIYDYSYDELREHIQQYIKTYCLEQNLPQISVRFADLENVFKIGFCAAEENLIVFNEKFLDLFEQNKDFKNMNVPFMFLDAIEHELDHCKQFLGLHTQEEKESYKVPLNDKAPHITVHEKNTYLRTFDLLEDIANTYSNELLKDYVAFRRIDFVNRANDEKQFLEDYNPEKDVDKLLLDMQKDISFASVLYKKDELKKININSKNTTNISYTTRIMDSKIDTNHEFEINIFEENGDIVGKITDKSAQSVVEFGVKNDTLHIFDVYNEYEDGISFANTLNNNKFFAKETELYKILNSAAQEYECKNNLKITNIEFNKYMLEYDNALRDKVVKQIKKSNNIHGNKFEAIQNEEYFSKIHELNAQKYFEDLIIKIKNVEHGDIRNTILPEEINIKDFNYYADTFLDEVYPVGKLNELYFRILNDETLDKTISKENIKNCFKASLDNKTKETLEKLIESKTNEKNQEYNININLEKETEVR